MRPRKSYEKDAFTTVIESLSTSSSSEGEEEEEEGRDAPFPRDEAHVTILSEIEKRLTKFPPRVIVQPAPTPAVDTALVLYRSPESMGLPKLERQRQEDMKWDTRKRIIEKRRVEKEGREGRTENGVDAGYEADAEDWGGGHAKRNTRINGYHNSVPEIEVPDVDLDADNDDGEDGDMMDLD